MSKAIENTNTETTFAIPTAEEATKVFEVSETVDKPTPTATPKVPILVAIYASTVVAPVDAEPSTLYFIQVKKLSNLDDEPAKVDENGKLSFTALQVERCYKVICENSTPVLTWKTTAKGNTTSNQIAVINAAYALNKDVGLKGNYYTNRKGNRTHSVTMLTAWDKKMSLNKAINEAKAISEEQI